MGGLFDLQINGFAGVDFQSAPSLAAVRHACEQLRKSAMKRVLATFVTDVPDALLGKLEAFERFRAQEQCIAETIVGYHLEGPYLSAEPGYKGAHPGELMKDPDWSEFRRQQDEEEEKHVPSAAGSSHEEHASHTEAPGPENLLAGHGVHVAAAAKENVPDGHKVQGCPADAYEPAVQGVQEEEKAAE
jgi:N-acetylglucosamine-6-phosphate deacetylase